MRLVGVALLMAWLLAWVAAPKGEFARSKTRAAGLAAARRGDITAVAWVEVTPGRFGSEEQLRVAEVQGGAVRPLAALGERGDLDYRLVDDGSHFVLATERRATLAPAGTEHSRWFTLLRLDGSVPGAIPDVEATFASSAWTVAAAGPHLVLVETNDSEQSAVHVLSDDGRWLPATLGGRALVDAAAFDLAAGGRVHTLVRYQVGHGGDRVVITPAEGSQWSLEAAHPACRPKGIDAATLAEEAPRVLAVQAVPGGFARLSRVGGWFCVDGVRRGAHFALPEVPYEGVSDPRLVVDAGGALGIVEGPAGQRGLYRRWLEDPAQATAPGARVAALSPSEVAAVDGSGASVLVTRHERRKSSVFLLGADGEVRIGPTLRRLPDHRGLLRALAALPISVLLLSLGASLRGLWRLVRLPAPSSLRQAAEARVAVAGLLADEGEVESGALRVRAPDGLMMVMLDGAEVISASSLGGRGDPQGPAVDGASGAAVFATGVIERGAAFRGEDRLRAGAGDVVVLGCTVAEARTRLLGRFLVDGALLGFAVGEILHLAL